MRLLVLLSICGVVLSAPLLEEKNSEHQVEKRSDEQIVYGNQQNPVKTKRSDLPAIDLKGKVLASQAQNIENVPDQAVKEAEKNPNMEEQLSHVIEANQVGNKPISDEGVDVGLPDESSSSNEGSSEEPSADSSPAEESEENKESGEDKNTLADNEDIIEQLDNMASGRVEPENNVKPPTDDSSSGMTDNDSQLTDNNLSDEFQAYQLYQNYQDLLRNYPYVFYGLPENRRKRAARRFINRLRGRRSGHRTKRELPFPYNEYFLSEAEVPEMPFSADAANEIYIPDDEIARDPYVNLLRELEVESEDEPLFENEGPYDDIKLINYDGQFGYFVPETSEEDVLTVPIRERKRDSYFFPFAQEPETHYGAFVPEKRSYEETYNNLLRLARALEPRRGYEEVYDWE